MPLIIETGAGTDPTANSYGSVQELRDYADARGVDLATVSDAQAEILMIKAMDYLESLAARYKGARASQAQPLQWPRIDVWGVSYFDALYPSDEIPRELKFAQLALAVEANAGNDLQPNDSGKGAIIKERIEGAVEIAYANQTGRARSPAFAKAEALLSSLLVSGGLKLVRG